MADDIEPEEKPICHPEDAGHHGTRAGPGQQAAPGGECRRMACSLTHSCPVPLPSGSSKPLLSAIPYPSYLPLKCSLGQHLTLHAKALCIQLQMEHSRVSKCSLVVAHLVSETPNCFSTLRLPLKTSLCLPWVLNYCRVAVFVSQCPADSLVHGVFSANIC